MISVGIGLGFSDSRSSDSRWLTTARAIWGASMLGYYTGTDINADVTAWPGRVGPTLVPFNANLFSVTTVRGRRALTCSTDAMSRLMIGDMGAAIKTLLVICDAEAADLPFTQYRRLVAVGNATNEGAQPHALVGNLGSSAWYTASGWTHYRDGSVNENVQAATSIYEGINASNTSTYVHIGGTIGYADRGWRAPIFGVIALGAAQSAQQRADSLPILRNIGAI